MEKNAQILRITHAIGVNSRYRYETIVRSHFFLFLGNLYRFNPFYLSPTVIGKACWLQEKV